MMPRKYHREYSQKYYHNRKAELIKMLGGSCAHCGSVNNIQFDHIDCNNRSFKIGNLLNHKWSDVLIEVKKCQLLCRKCHNDKSKLEGSFQKGRLLGENVATAKLNNSQVSEIKKMLKLGARRNWLSESYGVSYSTIYFIDRGVSWKSID